MKKALGWFIAWLIFMLGAAILPPFIRKGQTDLFPKAPWIAPAHRIRAQAAKLMCRKYSLRPAGAGGGLMDGVNRLSLSFYAPTELTHDEARRLVALCMEDFLSLVNADDEIRPYLCEYPFPPSAISIAIASPCQDAAKASQVPYVSIAWSGHGHICIAYHDAESEHRSFKEVIEEPFEEALAIVKAQEKKRMAQATTAKGTLSDP